MKLRLSQSEINVFLANKVYTRTIIFILSICILLMAAEANLSSVSAVWQFQVFQTSFTASKHYDNPFTNTEVNVIFENSGKQWVVTAYWSGGIRWTVWFTPPSGGIYVYHIGSTRKTDIGLNGHTVRIRILKLPFLYFVVLRFSNIRTCVPILTEW